MTLDASGIAAPSIEVLPTPPCGLGESPLWWPERHELWWVDIAGGSLHRFRPADGVHTAFAWARPDAADEPACLAPLPDGRLLVAGRAGLFRFDPARGTRERLAGPPYDPADQRFNDGKADPQGRFWAGSVCEPREPARAGLWRRDADGWTRVSGGLSTSNGLAWSLDGRTMYASDTSAHRIDAFDFDPSDGSVANRRVFASFARRPVDGSLQGYGGRPDGAAVDAEGGYWVAMYEGARLLRLLPDGRVAREIALPVQCPTMPCFGGPDLRTLYITTARKGRPADELARQPAAGHVLALRVDVPGLPVNFATPP